ncbi:MAG: response regulator [Dehalococcoidales bacterium]|nr:response regulator [Dehalococcoidales bacterium]
MKCAILCVDDEALLLFSLKLELIGHFGNRFQYETALNAIEALHVIGELLKDNIKVILIITDWLMPGMLGDEFLIQVNKNYPDIKSIVLSGQADQKSIEKVETNCNLIAFIEKPYNSNQIFSIIEKEFG